MRNLINRLKCLIHGHRFPSIEFDTRYEYHCTRCYKLLADCGRIDNRPLTKEEMDVNNDYLEWSRENDYEY